MVAKSTPSSSPKGAALAEPAPCGALGARACHARDDRADGGVAYRRAEAELVEQGTQAELVHCPQGDVLHPDRAWANQRQGVDVDVLNVATLSCRLGGAADTLMGEELGGDALGVRFERRGAIRWQRELTGEDVVDASAKYRPIVLGDIEVSSQIEQGTLSHLGAGAFGAHESEGEISLVTASGRGASDEHGGRIPGRDA